ncbi:MAG: hemerythrin domain-containing protein [Kineosporiaceae bacterium]
MPDIVDLIKSQHRTMDELLEQTQQEGADIPALLQQVAALLTPHSQAEESFVYPRIQQLEPEEGSEVHDGAAEHHHVEQLMQELLASEPDAPGFDGKLAAMIAEIRHHVEEEEQDLLPVLAEQADDDERAELGARFAEQTGVADDSRAKEPLAGSSDSTVDLTKEELYEKAKEQDVSGRSTMTKDELAKAVE